MKLYTVDVTSFKRRAKVLNIKATRKSGCKTVRGRKAKGRNGVLAVKMALHRHFPRMKDSDIYVKTGSAGGVDIHFSPAMAKAFPFDVEVKCRESLNIWSALQQALANSKPQQTPIVFFKRNHTVLYVALAADDFLNWIA